MSSTVKICHADLEHGIDMSGEASISLSNANDGRECRICHMDLESERHLYGIPIELGCSCKNDLAAAHKLCAETWFRSQGRRYNQAIPSLYINSKFLCFIFIFNTSAPLCLNRKKQMFVSLLICNGLAIFSLCVT